MQQRNLSLDIFRGITVIFMVIVNNPGSWSHVYKPLQHARWNGLLGADLVFPFFLIAVGMSIPFAHNKRSSMGETNLKILLNVCIRSILLFSLGIFLNAYPEFTWEGLRIPGVLQRIAIVYLVAYGIFLIPKESIRISLFIGILIFYYFLITKIPPPDWNGIGTFKYSAYNNTSAYLDRLLLDGHLWKHSKFWDPEGVLSTFPSIGSAMIGIWFTIYAIQSKLRLLLVGTIFLLSGYLFDIFFPINKTIWSSSFVLVTGGYAAYFYLLLTWIPESRSNIFKPILLMGTHALFVFFIIGIISRSLIYNWDGFVMKLWLVKLFHFIQDPKLGSFLYAISYLTLLFPIVWGYSMIRKFYDRIQS